MSGVISRIPIASYRPLQLTDVWRVEGLTRKAFRLSEKAHSMQETMLCPHVISCASCGDIVIVTTHI